MARLRDRGSAVVSAGVGVVGRSSWVGSR